MFCNDVPYYVRVYYLFSPGLLKSAKHFRAHGILFGIGATVGGGSTINLVELNIGWVDFGLVKNILRWIDYMI